MIVLLVSGYSVRVVNAKAWTLLKDTIEVTGARDVVLATFMRDKVLGVFYDNEAMVTYGFAEGERFWPETENAA